ncbi:MAG: hypothetical protein PHF11_03575 [Candidatus Omnitrophica bacterium]|nr:hypothetical protein [Candidatus Omnitrophota bacterium]
MESKGVCAVRAILKGLGILLLLGAAFDVLPITDNFAIFLALACFVISWVVRGIAKSGGSACCK